MEIYGGRLEDVTEAAEKAGLQIVGSDHKTVPLNSHDSVPLSSHDFEDSLQVALLLPCGETWRAVWEMMHEHKLKHLDFFSISMSPSGSSEHFLR